MESLSNLHSSFLRSSTTLTSRIKELEDRVIRIGGDVLREKIIIDSLKSSRSSDDDKTESKDGNKSSGGKDRKEVKNLPLPPIVGALNSIVPTLSSLYNSAGGMAGEPAGGESTANTKYYHLSLNRNQYYTLTYPSPPRIALPAADFTMVPERGGEDLRDLPAFLVDVVNVGGVVDEEGGRGGDCDDITPLTNEKGKGKKRGKEDEGEDRGGKEGEDEYEFLARYEKAARGVYDDFKAKRVKFK